MVWFTRKRTMKLMKAVTRLEGSECHVFETHSCCCMWPSFIAKSYSIVRIHYNLFSTLLLMNIWGVSRLQLLCKGTINILAQVFFVDLWSIFLESIRRDCHRIDKCMFSFVRNCHKVSQSKYAIWHSHQHMNFTWGAHSLSQESEK